jgi:hypothetical protein
MQFKPFLLFIWLFSFSCNNNAGSAVKKNDTGKTSSGNNQDDNPYARIAAIPLPAGFERKSYDSNSFAGYLRNIGLKKDKTVYLFNGQPKYNQSAQFAVLNISVGNKDLQQCADAVMRLRAEFMFAQNKFDQVVFFDNNNTAYKFLPPYTKENFATYLNRVFGMCGTASLSKQLKTVIGLSAIEAGDVLIRGGFPGHAVIVMDVAMNTAGKKIYLLAQGFMPAQDIHVLKNPMNENLSPWYEVNNNNIIQTPEYTFYKNELKSW